MGKNRTKSKQNLKDGDETLTPDVSAKSAGTLGTSMEDISVSLSEGQSSSANVDEVAELRKQIEQLKKDKTAADRSLSHKTNDWMRLNAEAGNHLTHLREIETHLHSVCNDLQALNGTTIEGVSSLGGDDSHANSTRVVVLVSLLHTLRDQLRGRSDEVAALNKQAYELKQDLDDANHRVHELQDDLQKSGDISGKQHEVSTNIIKSLKSQLSLGDVKAAATAEVANNGSAPSPSSSSSGTELAALRAEKEAWLEREARLLAELAAADEELRSSQKDLLHTTNDHSASIRNLSDLYIQLNETEAGHAATESSLQAEIARLSATNRSHEARLRSAEEDKAALEKKANQLQGLYQASLSRTPKKDSNSPQPSPSNTNGGNNKPFASDASAERLTELQKANQELILSLGHLSESHAAHVAESTQRIADLQEALAAAESGHSAKTEELTTSLQASTDALANHLTAKAAEAKNSEKLIVALELALDNSKKEVVALTTRIAELENKVVDQQRSLTERKNSRSNSFVDGAANDELSILRKEVLSQTAEITDLRQRVSDLTSTNAKQVEDMLHQRKVSNETESSLNVDILNMLSQIAAMKTAHAVEVDGLQTRLAAKREHAIATASANDASARLAETRVAFTKEGLRAHLKANGVKVFFWDDMYSLLKKVEVLHSNPAVPVISLASLAVVSEVDPSAEVSPTLSASTGATTPGKGKRHSVASQGTTASLASSTTGVHKITSPTPKPRSFLRVSPKKRSQMGFFSENDASDSEPLQHRNHCEGVVAKYAPGTGPAYPAFRSPQAKASFHYGGSFASSPYVIPKDNKFTPTLTSPTPSNGNPPSALKKKGSGGITPVVDKYAEKAHFRRACVDKSDPFGDTTRKVKAARVTYKETVEKYDSFKRQHSPSFRDRNSSPTRDNDPNSAANIDSFLEASGATAVEETEEEDTY